MVVSIGGLVARDWRVAVSSARDPLCTLDRHKQQFISGNEPASLAATLLRNTGFETRACSLCTYVLIITTDHSETAGKYLTNNLNFKNF